MDHPSRDGSPALAGGQQQSNSRTNMNENCLKTTNLQQQHHQEVPSISLKKRKLTPKIVKKRISKIISPKTTSSDTKQQRDGRDTSGENKSKGFYFAGFGSHETTNNNNNNNDLSINCDPIRRYNNYHHQWLLQDASSESKRANKTMSLCPELEKSPTLQQAFFSTSLQRHQKHYYISTAQEQQQRSAPSSLSLWSTPRVFPNNTLIADLSQCHPNSIHQLPDLGLEATSKSLMFSLNQCWKPTKEQNHQLSLQKDQQQHEQISQVTPAINNSNININESHQHNLRSEADIYSKRRKSFSHQSEDCEIESETTTMTRMNNDNLRLRLDLMIPKSTNSLPASLMSQLDAQSLLRLQQTSNEHSYSNARSHLNSTRITSISNQTQISETISNEKKFNYKTESNEDDKRTTRRRRPVKFEMPEELLGTRVRLKREDYDEALCVLTSDFRYQLHLILYSRIQSLWLLMSTILCMFIPFVFMVPEMSVLVMSSALWFFLQLVGGLATFAARKSLNRMLERAVAQANSYFMDHNLMLGVINFGGIFAKSKLMVPLVYFDTTPCRIQIESVLGSQLAGTSKLSNNNNESGKTGDSPNGISIISGNSNILPSYDAASSGSALAKSQMAKKIVLKYSQRWISQYDRRKLLFSGDDDDQIEPRHLSTGKCICQFFEAQYLEAKAASAAAKPEGLTHVTVDGLARKDLANDVKIDLHDELRAASPDPELASRQTTTPRQQNNNKIEQILSTLHHNAMSHEQQQPTMHAIHHHHYEHCDLEATAQGLGGGRRSSNEEARAKNVTANNLPLQSGINKGAFVGTTARLSDWVTKATKEQASSDGQETKSASWSLQQAAVISRPTYTTHQQELLADPSMRQVQQMGFSQLALMSSP